ncbi:MAG TPA: Ig-like domain-containing protein, partial [Fibrella sp.]
MKTSSFRYILTLAACAAFSGASFGQVSQSIGTIPSADSIVVYHDVTINTSFLPAGFNRIASRGTVAGTGFSVLTDDPDTVPVDSTITIVNRVPVFANGASTPFTVCQNTSAQSINSLLTASDDNTAQTLTWTVTTVPANGTLTGLPTTAPTTGGSVTPAGLTYQPTAGYTGSDAFIVQLSDGFDAVSITVNVTVTSPVANNSVSGNQTICPGNTPAQLTGSLPTGGNGTYSYLWESSTTSATTGFAAAAGTNNGQNYQPGAVSVPTWYRRTVTSISCAADVSSTTVAISITNINTWTGTASTAWSNVANWSCGTLPTITTDVVIPAVTTQPIVDITTAVANTLTVNSGANLQFSAPGSRLDVYGTINNNGTFDALPGTVGFRSTAPQNIPAGQYSTIV